MTNRMTNRLDDHSPAHAPGAPAFILDWRTLCGMTMRDWFAGQIAGGLAAHSGTAGINNGPGQIAERAYEVADAMLAARAIPKEQADG